MSNIQLPLIGPPGTALTKTGKIDKRYVRLKMAAKLKNDRVLLGKSKPEVIAQLGEGEKEVPTGFRPGRSAHDALRCLVGRAHKKESELLDHQWIMQFLKHRIAG